MIQTIIDGKKSSGEKLHVRNNKCFIVTEESLNFLNISIAQFSLVSSLPLNHYWVILFNF